MGPRWTLAGTLDAVAPHLAPALVDAAALDRVRALAALFPAALTDWLYLECRLDEEDQVDLALYVVPAARESLGLVSAANGWDSVVALGRTWAAHDGALGDALEGVWLELDAPAEGGAGKEAAAPGVFVDFTDEVCHAQRLGTLDVAATADRALGALLGGTRAPGVTPILEHCLRALPPHAFVLYVGAMPSRRRDAARLCVMGLEPDEIVPYLRVVGWPGRDRDASSAVSLLTGDEASGTPSLLLQMDVADGVAPRIGIELALERGAQLRGRIAECALLDRLCRTGLCTPEKRAALPSWPGHEVRVLPHQLWPSLVARRLNHVKLVLAEDGGLTAKGYLCVHHELAPRRSQ